MKEPFYEFAVPIILVALFAAGVAVVASEGSKEEAYKDVCKNAGGIYVDGHCVDRRILIDIKGDYQ